MDIILVLHSFITGIDIFRMINFLKNVKVIFCIYRIFLFFFSLLTHHLSHDLICLRNRGHYSDKLKLKKFS